MEHPFSSTLSPSVVLGHLSLSSATPSLSESSCDNAQPSEFTVTPVGVLEHLSRASATPSLSESINSNSAVIVVLEIILNINGFAVPLPVPVHCLKE